MKKREHANRKGRVHWGGEKDTSIRGLPQKTRRARPPRIRRAVTEGKRIIVKKGKTIMQMGGYLERGGRERLPYGRGY